LILVEFGKQGGLGFGQRLIGLARDVGFRFQIAIGAYMQEFVAALDEDATDEETSMAMSGIFLTAHQGNSKLCESALQAVDTGQKSWSGRALAIENAAGGVVILLASGTAAELIAEKEVFDSGSRQIPLQGCAIELRGKFRVGRRAGVYDNFDVVASEKRCKRLERVRGMTDCVYGAHDSLLRRLAVRIASRK
jgi:hypothetical protein